MPERDATSDTEVGRGRRRPTPGLGIIRASWVGTILFSVSAVATAVAPHTFVAVGVGVSLVLFFVGIGLFLWAYAVAVNRSRTDLIGLGGLFFLVGSAPRRVQRSLLGSFAVEIVVGLVTAGRAPVHAPRLRRAGPDVRVGAVRTVGGQVGDLPASPARRGSPQGPLDRHERGVEGEDHGQERPRDPAEGQAPIGAGPTRTGRSSRSG